MTITKTVNSDPFNLTVSALIVANAAVLGAGTFPGLADSPILNTLNNLFYSLFVIELVLRIASYGRNPLAFFRTGWNVFDFITVTAALIPGVGGSAQALRLIRLARVIRLARFLPDAKVLISSVIKSLAPLSSLVVLTVLLLFVYGMAGWSLFGEQLPDNWGNVATAMMTLFVLLTLENFPTYLEEATAVSPYAVPFFISYVLLAAFIIFNLLIGIIIESMEQAREAETDKNTEPAAVTTESIAALRNALDALEAELAAQHQPKPCALQQRRGRLTVSDSAPGRV